MRDDLWNCDCKWIFFFADRVIFSEKYLDGDEKNRMKKVWNEWIDENERIDEKMT